ncbi:unnamed protein product, partial [Prorocentrum cordatum]
LWLEEAASPLARACPREAARRPSRPPWPARSPSCACWCRRPPRRRSAWRAASVGRSARPAAEPPPLPARNRARPPRGPPAPAGPPPRRSRRARWPARPPRRRGALRRPRRRGPGVCPTRDGGRRLLHAERHRHESQGGRDQGVSRRRALCCSPSTCSRGADMSLGAPSAPRRHSAAGALPARRSRLPRRISGHGGPGPCARFFFRLVVLHIFNSMVGLLERPLSWLPQLCPPQARESGGLGRPCVFSR